MLKLIKSVTYTTACCKKYPKVEKLDEMNLNEQQRAFNQFLNFLKTEINNFFKT